MLALAHKACVQLAEARAAQWAAEEQLQLQQHTDDKCDNPLIERLKTAFATKHADTILAIEHDHRAALLRSQTALREAQHAAQSNAAECSQLRAKLPQGNHNATHQQRTNVGGTPTTHAATEHIMLSLRTDTGGFVSIQARSLELVNDIKVRAADALGVSSAGRALVYRFRELDDTASLSESGVGDKCVLRLAPQRSSAARQFSLRKSFSGQY